MTNPVDAKLSVIIPVFNEESNIDPLVGRLKSTLEKTGSPFEIIIVNDGSKDSTWNVIEDLAKKDPAVKALSLTRNFGHQHALFCGLSYASGAGIICMDGDLQHPPEIIPEMRKAWQSGIKIVTTKRLNHPSKSLFKNISSIYFYRLFSWLSGVQLTEGSSDFCLIDRAVADQILRFNDCEPFIRGALRWTGFPRVEIPYQEEQRSTGKSKYGLFKMVRFATSAIVSFSTTPLKLGIWLGIMTSVLAFSELVYILIKYFQGVTVPGWASTLGILSLLFGVLFILLGCIGIYLANIHEILKARPRFIVNRTINF